jgi:hypothetical protein
MIQASANASCASVSVISKKLFVKKVVEPSRLETQKRSRKKVTRTTYGKIVLSIGNEPIAAGALPELFEN